MADNILRAKSKEIAKLTVLLCRELKNDRVEAVLINQLLRSGTSIGANIHEAQFAQGTKDFISKLEIALKECNESEYWLELLLDTCDGCKGSIETLLCRCVELRRMLIAAVKTLKSKTETQS